MCCRFRTVLHCTFPASCTLVCMHCPFSRFSRLITPSSKQIHGLGTEMPHCYHCHHFYLCHFIQPDRFFIPPAKSPRHKPVLFHAESHSILSTAVHSPLCGPKAAAAGLAAARQVQGNMPIPCIQFLEDCSNRAALPRRGRQLWYGIDRHGCGSSHKVSSTYFRYYEPRLDSKQSADTSTVCSVPPFFI
jgi:hypothetical protein